MGSIKLCKLENATGLPLPSYATVGSSGVDLMAAITDNIIIKSGHRAIVPTGISIALPPMYEAQIRPRSGLAAKNGITVLNTPGTVDNDYRGEVKVILINHGQEDFVIERGMRIAQVVIAKYEQFEILEVDSLDSTERGGSGFGSTGK